MLHFYKVQTSVISLVPEWWFRN